MRSACVHVRIKVRSSSFYFLHFPSRSFGRLVFLDSPSAAHSPFIFRGPEMPGEKRTRRPHQRGEINEGSLARAPPPRSLPPLGGHAMAAAARRRKEGGKWMGVEGREARIHARIGKGGDEEEELGGRGKCFQRCLAVNTLAGRCCCCCSALLFEATLFPVCVYTVGSRQPNSWRVAFRAKNSVTSA